MKNAIDVESHVEDEIGRGGLHYVSQSSLSGRACQGKYY